MSASPTASNSNQTFSVTPSSNLIGLTTYKILVTTGVKDPSGNLMNSTYTSSNGFTTADVTAPVLTEVTAVPTQTNNNTPSYTFSSTEAGTITYGGSCSSGNTSASTDNNTVTFNVLADQVYDSCTITVTDSSNNASSSLNVNTFTVDTTAPTVNSFTSSSADDSYKSAGTVNITATASETVVSGNTITVTLDTGDTVLLRADANGTTLVGTYTVGSGDTSSDLTVNSFSIGTVTDSAGNAMTSTTVPATNIASGSAIVIDTTAPTTTWSAATDNVGTVTGVLSSGDTTDDTGLVLSGTNEAGSSVMVYNGSTQLGSATISGTNWSYSSTVANGTTYQFNVTGTDPAGNTSAATTNFTVTGDTTAPTLAITLSDTNIKFGETSTITFNFSETPSNFATADITVQNGSIGSTLAVNGGDNTLYTATFTPTPGANDTTNEVSVGQAWTDAAGHAPAADSRSANYIVDL